MIDDVLRPARLNGAPDVEEVVKEAVARRMAAVVARLRSLLPRGATDAHRVVDRLLWLDLVTRDTLALEGAVVVGEQAQALSRERGVGGG